MLGLFLAMLFELQEVPETLLIEILRAIFQLQNLLHFRLAFLCDVVENPDAFVLDLVGLLEPLGGFEKEQG